jgi:Uma2 family endonuclease
MITLPWRNPPLTEEQAEDLFMLFLEDDTEDAPWMVMGDLQYWSATGLAHSLRYYVHERRLPWYVASMLPINFRWRTSRRKHTLAPDLFVAFVADHPRTSFDVKTEGGFPPFVLEVVSPSSTVRDRDEKLDAYGLMKVQEYLLFTPKQGKPSLLEGYFRDSAGKLGHRSSDEVGRLWSEVLGLYFVVQDTDLRAQTPDGQLLPTLAESEAARRQAETERQQEQERVRLAEEEARRAREEADRLREELDRLRGQMNRES